MTRYFKIILCIIFSYSIFSCKENSTTAIVSGSDSTLLFNLIDRASTYEEKEFPDYKEMGNEARLYSNTEKDILRHGEFYQDLLIALDSIDYEGLSWDNQINYELFRYRIKNTVSEVRYKSYLNPILADAGFHTSLPFLPGRFQFDRIEDYNIYLKLLESFPIYIQDHIDLMRKGLDLQISQPAIILEGYESTYEKHIVQDAKNSLFFKPFKKYPEHFTEVEKQRLEESAKEAIEGKVVPAFQTLSTFMSEEYLLKTRKTLGARDMPDGEAYYQDRLDYYTTLNLSADSIHQLGLYEVDRIRGEMVEVMKETGFEGELDEFIAYLRKDPKFSPKSGEELLKEASFYAKRMDGKLPALFGKLPRQPYTVSPVPDHLAPKYTAGRYSGSPISSTRPGYYWVNTYDLPSRTLYTLEALTYHEAVPGHHLQGALSKELEDLPDFRKGFYISAFGEGWGLYSEYLGKTVGFFEDPYSDFGRLTYEMWRACRLVVDTGIHAFGWSRDSVMNYMATNTALSMHEIRTETDRYISWPGQAVSYKIGELKIKSLRSRAEEELKDKFDVREFHDMILSEGAVTLSILEKMTNRYIENKLSENESDSL